MKNKIYIIMKRFFRIPVISVICIMALSACDFGLNTMTTNAKKLLFGTSVGIDTFTNESSLELLTNEFNAITTENALKWKFLQRADGSWNFNSSDTIIDMAENYGLDVRGHTLVWHNGLPPWIASDISADELETLIKTQIKEIVSRYKGRIDIWDVVNEAYNGRGTLRKSSVLTNKLGDSYIENAFIWAHEADPDAKLFYNDFGIGEMNKKSDIVYDKVKELVEKGVPIHGIGMQMHVSTENYPDPDSLSRNIRRFGDLGLEVQITEMDVTIGNCPGIYEEKLMRQAEVYETIISACLKEDAFTGMTFWGITDKYSWRNQSGDEDPLIFDDQYNKKPAYYALKKLVEEYIYKRIPYGTNISSR